MDSFENVLLNIIIILHICFILFVVVTPFIGNNYFLFLHAIVVPFIMLHWYINDNNCVLTLLEKEFRYRVYGTVPDPNECFTHRIIAPVYDFANDNENQSSFIYIITIILWVISLSRLYYNYKTGKLNSIDDLKF